MCPLIPKVALPVLVKAAGQHQQTGVTAHIDPGPYDIRRAFDAGVPPRVLEVTVVASARGFASRGVRQPSVLSLQRFEGDVAAVSRININSDNPRRSARHAPIRSRILTRPILH